MLANSRLVRGVNQRIARQRINAERANLGLVRSNQFPQFEASSDITTNRNSRNALNIPGQSGGGPAGGQKASKGSSSNPAGTCAASSQKAMA